MSTYKVDGKVALVTGGASGIGEACVLTLARDGAMVVVVDRDSTLGERTVAAVKAAGGDAVFVRVDVARSEEVEQMVETTIATFGRLDIAVNNAGILGAANPVGTYRIDDWHEVIAINLNGVFYCLRYEIPHMLENGGAIVNVASFAGSVGFANAPAYVAAKHGVVGLTRAAALEYGKHGIRVNAVGPSFIITPMMTGRANAEVQQSLSGLLAVGRLGEAQEVANVVAFLCSEDASFVTGAYVPVDGGYTAQ